MHRRTSVKDSRLNLHRRATRPKGTSFQPRKLKFKERYTGVDQLRAIRYPDRGEHEFALKIEGLNVPRRAGVLIVHELIPLGQENRGESRAAIVITIN